MSKLPGDYVAGFVDGEGCFFLNYRRDVKYKRANAPTYFSWKIGFAILLREDDETILNLIRETLSCGKINRSLKGHWVRYEITKVSELRDKILPFFNQYPLRAKKKEDFLLWKQALEIFIAKERFSHQIKWNDEEKVRLQEIYIKMLPLKSGNRSSKWLPK